jgi:hypothetical protein
MERVRISPLFGLSLITALVNAGSLPAFADVTVSTLTRTLKTWTPEEIKKLRQVGTFNSQKLIFDESAKTLELAERADIDLVTVYGKNSAGKPKIARVPRFMIWRDAFKISFDSKSGRLSSRATPTHLKVPLDLFTLHDITKIELSQHHSTYPGTRLRVRTNPAASRGEKLYTQNCLACHSFANPLDPTSLTAERLKAFTTQHVGFQGLVIDARDARGLTAYAEALASEKTQVPSPPKGSN